MSFIHIWLNSYLQPRRALDALAEQTTPGYGAGYTLVRGVMLALLFYLPFYLLNFEPLTPAYLQILDTPDYFLYAALIWPVFGLFSWVYLSGVVYLLLRLLGYRANFDQLLNVGGLLGLTIGVVLLVFDWLTVVFGFHTNAVFLGLAHVLIADPWSIALTAYFYRKYFGAPVWLSVLLGILVRLLFVPVAIVFIRT
jgi:hypothetical protein